MMSFSLKHSFQPDFLPTAYQLHRLGFDIYATQATAEYLNAHKIPARTAQWPLKQEGSDPSATRYSILLLL